jgi:hypothetical protein
MNGAIIDYQTANAVDSPDAAQLFAKARAAEVVWCARNWASVDGFADLLYATRLAGAPLNPAAALV